MKADEFDEFYATSFPRVVRQVFAMIGNWAEAQDCVQEAFVRAWTDRARLDRDGSPEAWVRTTAYRLAVSRWRRLRKDSRAADRSLAPPTPYDDPRLEALLDALATLPLEQRRTLVLHHLCDLSVAQVARETGAPEGTVKARLSRGRSALQDRLDQPTPARETDHV